jgi:hypothetical protein
MAPRGVRTDLEPSHHSAGHACTARLNCGTMWFVCDLPEGHKGDHHEEGISRMTHYIISWQDSG